jgi:putative heme degradation protein
MMRFLKIRMIPRTIMRDLRANRPRIRYRYLEAKLGQSVSKSEAEALRAEVNVAGLESRMPEAERELDAGRSCIKELEAPPKSAAEEKPPEELPAQTSGDL